MIQISPSFWTSLPSPAPSHPSRLVLSPCLSILAWEISPREELYSPQGCKRVRHNCLTKKQQQKPVCHLFVPPITELHRLSTMSLRFWYLWPSSRIAEMFFTAVDIFYDFEIHNPFLTTKGIQVSSLNWPQAPVATAFLSGNFQPKRSSQSRTPPVSQECKEQKTLSTLSPFSRWIADRRKRHICNYANWGFLANCLFFWTQLSNFICNLKQQKLKESHFIE